MPRSQEPRPSCLVPRGPSTSACARTHSSLCKAAPGSSGRGPCPQAAGSVRKRNFVFGLKRCTPCKCDAGRGAQRVSPRASVSSSVKWGPKLRGAPLAGLREREGIDGSRQAGVARHSLFGARGARWGSVAAPDGKGRASMPSTSDPASSPKSPLQGSGKEGVGPAPDPDGVWLALGGAPRFPRGPETQAGLTHRVPALGVVHPAPHITQRVGAGTARVGGQATEASVPLRRTRQVSLQLPALRGGASGSPGGGGRRAWHVGAGPSGRDLGSSGVFIRLKLPAGC